MKQNMQLQKIFFLVCFLLGIAMFIYALIFMTDYQVLFGFERVQNKAIADFYTNKLQVFNRSILAFGITMILGFSFMWFTRIKSEVCNFFTLVINALFILYVVVKGVIYIFQIKDMIHIYINLDYSYTYLEDLFDYQINTFMLDLGIVLNYVIIVTTLIFLAIIIINFLKYLSLHEGVKTYFNNLKENSIFRGHDEKNES